MFRLTKSVDAKVDGDFEKYFNSLNAAILYANRVAENPDLSYGGEHDPLIWKWNFHRFCLSAMDYREDAFYTITEIETYD